ncbi:MAG TPA: hypothetical protein DC000_03505 [Clostridiales bacterium]|nr:hypothetical protein [Clostridiales bacterium]
MEIVNGVMYEYVKVYPNGDKAYGYGCNPTQEQLDELNETMSRAWDNLSEEKKKEINKKMREKYRTKRA